MTMRNINPLDLDNIREEPVSAIVNKKVGWVIVAFGKDFGTNVAIMGKLVNIKSTVILAKFDGARISISRDRCEFTNDNSK